MDPDPWTLDDFEISPPVPRSRDREPAGRGTRREVFGRVYELITGDPRDGEHPYVGKTEQTIHQRVHGPGGHTSAADIAKDPWKARILPGRAGHRQLAVVYASGDPRHDDLMLRNLEAFWIDKLRTTHNDVRPVRPPLHQPQPARKADRAPKRKVPTRAERRARRRVITLAVLVVLFTALAAKLVVMMELPWPQAPWIASPIAGAAFAWATFQSVHKRYRKLTGRRS